MQGVRSPVSGGAHIPMPKCLAGSNPAPASNFMVENLEKMTIYFDGESLSIPAALEKITDELVDEGEYCGQTVIDLRDALKFVLENS